MRMHVTPKAAAEQPPVIPPAEGWLRTPLVQIEYLDPSQSQGDVVLMAGTTGDMRSRKDVRALIPDFVPLVQGRNVEQQAVGDALRAAAALSKGLNDRFLWLSNPTVAVLQGRDGWLWAIPLRNGDGTEAIGSDDSGLPSLDDYMGAQFTPKAWDDDVLALVSGDRYFDLREGMRGGAGDPTLVRAVPASGPAQGSA